MKKNKALIWSITGSTIAGMILGGFIIYSICNPRYVELVTKHNQNVDDYNNLLIDYESLKEDTKEWMEAKEEDKEVWRKLINK